jgi:hypothetical protein
MPTSRTPISRPRHPSFTPEALALFAELERMPRRDRDGDAFRNGSKELARQLGLSTEWWGGCDVNDDSAGPCWSPDYAAYGYWFKVRAVREALLEAAAPA